MYDVTKKVNSYLKAINKKSTGEKIVLARLLNIRGRLIFGNELMESIGSIIEELQFVFPDRWDIQFEIHNSCLKETVLGMTIKGKIILKAEFVIHFPEINITNSSGMSHTITDLYVKLESVIEASTPTEGQNPKISFSNFRGKRMSASKAEILSEYIHSHIPGGRFVTDNEKSFYGQSSSSRASSPFIYRSFCKGTSEINQIIAMLYSKYDANLFRMFLMQLELYLSWESIEGRPHKYMKYVLGKIDAEALAENDIKKFFDKLPKENTNLDFIMKKDEIQIVDNQKFEDYLNYLNTSNFRDYKIEGFQTRFFCYKDELGNYFGIKIESSSIPSFSLSTEEELKEIGWYFRGQLVEFKVTQEKVKEVEEDRPFYVHYKIKEYAKQRFENSIKTKRFRSYISSQLSKINNT